MCRLHIAPAEGTAFEHEIESDSLVIGRSSRCDLAVADRCLSRQHLRIFKEGEAWMVEDLGSRNGTTLNGIAIEKPTRLSPGDRIAASLSTIRFGGVDDPSRGAHASEGRNLYRDASEILADTERDLGVTSDQRRIQRAMDQLRVLNDVHRALAVALTTEELFDSVLDRVFVHLQPQHAAIFLAHDRGLVRAAARTATGASEDFPESTSLASEVIGKGMGALVQDTSTDDRFLDAQSLLEAGIRTLVAAPLLTPEGSLGMIVVSSGVTERVFGEHDMELLVVVAYATGLKMRNLALAEEAAERRRLEQEVVIARRIQVALLPSRMPEVPGVEIHGGNTPSRGVSGDYYQVVHLPNRGEVALIIADVSGKGIGASLLTGYVDALVNAYVSEGLEPAEIFARVSPQMNAKTPVESFATSFLGLYSIETGHLRYASAGHDPSLLVRNHGDIELLDPTGMPLGLMPEAAYSEATATLEPGETLVLYTDGITEAAKANDTMFERERLVEVCREHRHELPARLAHSIHAAVAEFVEGEPYADDQTLLILRRVR